VFTLLIFVGLLGLLALHAARARDARGHAEPAMAASMGIKTSRIDALTFGSGSGIAGLRTRGVVADRQCQPPIRQGYIIDSFLGRGVRRRRQSLGTLVGAFTLGIANKFLGRSPCRCSARSPSWC